MNIIIGLFVAVLGLLYLQDKKNKAKKALLETQAKDQVLAEQQKAVAEAIETLDAGIEKMKKQKEIDDRKREFDNLSLKERADKIKKGLQ